jgi:hypothetical protein
VAALQIAECWRVSVLVTVKSHGGALAKPATEPDVLTFEAIDDIERGEVHSAKDVHDANSVIHDQEPPGNRSTAESIAVSVASDASSGRASA